MIAINVNTKPAAHIEQFAIRERHPAFGGAEFGKVGAYEWIAVTAVVRVDPEHPANRNIVDLAFAPRHAKGGVRYSTELLILRPENPACARSVLLYDVVNRGMQLAHAMFNDEPLQFGVADEPGQGNGFLMREGFTLVWAGWQSGLDGQGLLHADFPVATDHGRSITGQVQQETVFDNWENPGSVRLAYPLAEPDHPQASVTVRARQSDPPHPLPTGSWRYVDERTISVDRPKDMDAGAIYEVVYLARDPMLAGLGFAVTRDIISFLRYGDADEQGNPNPLADFRHSRSESSSTQEECRDADRVIFDSAIAIGFSQSGRYLRDWLWQGFNTDGKGRPVFDGLLVFIAGARTTFTNVRWAQPDRFSRQHEDQRVYGNQFPFTYSVITDPVTGATDGILKQCLEAGNCPKLFHIDTSSEFWQAGASLIGTDGAGKDLSLPSNVRAYHIAGAPHGTGYAEPHCALPANPLPYSPVSRALLLAMTDWISAQREPPPSAWPSITDGTLVSPRSAESIGYPDFTPLGFTYSGAVNEMHLTDYTQVPPRIITRNAWQVLVPNTDADGNELAGIRVPELAVPRGTYLGWNPRREQHAPGALCLIYGSYVPFTASKSSRLEKGDSRLSLAERYSSELEYDELLRKAAETLHERRLMLVDDLKSYYRS